MSETSDLEEIYRQRFAGREAYRNLVWDSLCKGYFQKWIPADSTILDLGCGYGEFINQISAKKKYGMDLNKTAASKLATDVTLLAQDCSMKWELPDACLDTVFTSNFFEHLPSKEALGRTLDEAFRCLKPRGRLIAMGPNIKFIPGAYWDFWDHYLPLTELSLAEGLQNRGFEVEEQVDRFLPYSMVNAPQYPIALLRLYLKLPPLWKFFGRQFLVIGRKPF